MMSHIQGQRRSHNEMVGGHSPVKIKPYTSQRFLRETNNILCTPQLCSFHMLATAMSLQSCLTLCGPMDCSLPVSSVHGIFQATVLEWDAIALMFKILQARLCEPKYMYQELPDVLARKIRGTRDQIANICWITEKAREFQKNIYCCFINYTKAVDCAYHDKL